MTLTEGCATTGGTERYRQRFTALQAAHFRPVQELWASSIGLQERIPGLSTSAQRAIQFVRSTPGVTTALVGMKEAAHVEENLAVAGTAPMDPADLAAIFARGRR